ncbi:MAG: alanine:cation symporter family protein [Marinilabiliaceae bacterium]|nr:alanine:cation symporter family protein [Marinilabiliaceae bacterium]
MNFSEIVSTLSSWVWGMPFIIFCLATGLYFSIRMRFLQVRYFKEMIRMLFKGKSSASGISSFQAFALALSGRIGTGNIAGVATAIALGGPGAVFWMWMIAFFGAGTAYIESSLGQIYKEKIDGNYRGGPAYYILKGLKKKAFAVAFAIVTVISLGLLLPGVQSNAICDAFKHSFGLNVHITAGMVILLLALIIFGGVKRIARVGEIVVPFMSIGYILIVLIILTLNYQQIPAVFSMIVKSAFGIGPAFSGMLGAAITMGVKRGIFSNEAGQGTGAHAAAASEVSHPAKQGLVQAFSVYVDTLLVCSATAFVILITGTYRVYNSMEEVIFIGQAMPETITSYGPVFTQLAIDSTFKGFGSSFVAVALFFFAFTTIMSYYFQAETNVYFLFRNKKTLFYMINTLRIAMLLVVFFAAVNTMKLAWNMADIGVGMMAWLNLIAIILLRKIALKVFADFEKQHKEGIKEPVFRSDKTGVEGAEMWEG